jgi:ankyrin repeat protein
MGVGSSQYMRILLFTKVKYICDNKNINVKKMKKLFNEIEKEQMTELFNAIENKDAEKCKRLIARNPNFVNKLDDYGEIKTKAFAERSCVTPLHLAAKIGCFDICTLLLENGADSKAIAQIRYTDHTDKNNGFFHWFHYHVNEFPSHLAKANGFENVGSLIENWNLSKLEEKGKKKYDRTNSESRR